MEYSRILSKDVESQTNTINQGWCKDIVRVEDDGEEEIAGVVLRTLPLFPNTKDGKPLSRSQKQPFRDLGSILPRNERPETSAIRVPGISGPIPDLVYGVKSTSFNEAERMAQLTQPIKRICQPIANVYWPFLSVEVKAPSKGGTMWIATNQCAGTGSACVKALTVLQEHDGSVPNEDPNSIAFSCAVDGRTTELFVHWYEAPHNFRLARINTYVLSRDDELLRLRRHVAGIVEWGVGERLAKIKTRLSQIFETTVGAARTGNRRQREEPDAEGGEEESTASA
ncbi:hypothetical protein B0A49_12976 [Cryomyces minteri]|uniref:DUF7924 domain-containing protein n=1 Tax=Cryomyces minteri TaxID=331657 RepID=A0A4U0WK30_9PEZI|nr:hypothetical protein B0A49_12976 [Cryomyces minteri]